ncbi:MAG: tyrosine-type recombinase/integrase [Oligoflexia bacterium]|nr:tyrosine-type recombinase/integrase [Oligoflexia bacterium]
METNIKELDDLFYEFIRTKGQSTSQMYVRDVERFISFLEVNQNMSLVCINSFKEIKRIHILKYLDYLENNPNLLKRNYANNSINRKISAISSFFHFLCQKEILESNPAQLVSRKKSILIRETQALTDKEVKYLFDLVLEKGTILHKAIIFTLFTTGIRQAELRNIEISDIKSIDGISILSIIAKGQSQHQIPLHPTTAYYLRTLLESYEDTDNKNSDWVFRASIGRKISKNKLSSTAVNYIVKKYARVISPKKNITPHSARATLISSLLDNGTDIFKVSQIVNHKDVRTTQNYNKRRINIKNNPIFTLNFF